MQTPRNTILFAILISATAALPFAAFGINLLLLFLAPALLVAGLLGWRFVRMVKAAEPELERRFIRWQYAKLAARAHKLMNSEVQS